MVFVSIPNTFMNVFDIAICYQEFGCRDEIDREITMPPLQLAIMLLNGDCVSRGIAANFL